MPLVRVLDQIKHAVRDNNVNATVGNQRSLRALFGHDCLKGLEIFERSHRVPAQVGISGIKVGPQILDSAAVKLDVVIAQLFANGMAIFLGQGQHLRRHINADHPACGPNDLGGNIANFARARSEIKHGFAGPEVLRGVSTAVIARQDFFGDDGEKALVIVHRTTQRRLFLLCAGGITCPDRLFDIQYLWHIASPFSIFTWSSAYTLSSLIRSALESRSHAPRCPLSVQLFDVLR